MTSWINNKKIIRQALFLRLLGKALFIFIESDKVLNVSCILWIGNPGHKDPQ